MEKTTVTEQSRIGQALKARTGEPTLPEAAEADGISIEEIARELSALVAEEKLPEGFDLERAAEDPALMELLLELPAAAAVRVYDAERRAKDAEEDAKARLTEQVRARNALPRATRSAAAANPAPDYLSMSAESFRTLEQQMKQAARSGRRTRL